LLCNRGVENLHKSHRAGRYLTPFCETEIQLTRCVRLTSASGSFYACKPPFPPMILPCFLFRQKMNHPANLSSKGNANLNPGSQNKSLTTPSHIHYHKGSDNFPESEDQNMPFPIPPIKDPALQKFCLEQNLYDAVAAAYHYFQKFFPTSTHIALRFRPPYYDDEPEDASIAFDIEIVDMTVKEVLDAEDRFFNATMDIPGIEYITPSYRFKHESS